MTGVPKKLDRVRPEHENRYNEYRIMTKIFFMMKLTEGKELGRDDEIYDINVIEAARRQ